VIDNSTLRAVRSDLLPYATTRSLTSPVARSRRCVAPAGVIPNTNFPRYPQHRPYYTPTPLEHPSGLRQGRNPLILNGFLYAHFRPHAWTPIQNPVSAAPDHPYFRPPPPTKHQNHHHAHHTTHNQHPSTDQQSTPKHNTYIHPNYQTTNNNKANQLHTTTTQTIKPPPS